jgi:hypothetical protein
MKESDITNSDIQIVHLGTMDARENENLSHEEDGEEGTLSH